MHKPFSIFVSSTCYDLLDVRRMLQSDLESKGFVVRLSDSHESEFVVGDPQDSIKTCLQNIKTSDAVICIVDKRYGPPITSYANKSATQVEVEFAHTLSIPILTFIRNRALSELHMLKRDSTSKCGWLDLGSKPDLVRAQFPAFLDLLTSLEAANNADPSRSNWYETFESIVDLKATVSNQLLRKFPQASVVLALRPDRLSRLHFVSEGGATTFHGPVSGHFRNATEQPAFNIEHGCRINDGVKMVGSRAALSFQENVSGASRDMKYPFTGPVQDYRAIYCVYENVFGDRYRIEIPVSDGYVQESLPGAIPRLGYGVASNEPALGLSHRYILGPERFFVQVTAGDEQKWLELESSRTQPPIPPITKSTKTAAVQS